MQSTARQFRGPFRSYLDGELELENERLRFTRDDGEVLFDEPVKGLRYHYPWYYFGGTFKVMPSGGKPVTITFARNARIGGALTAARGIKDAAVAIRSSKAWRAALEEATGPR